MHGSFKDRTGEINVNKNGSKMIVEKYHGTNDILVKFIDSNYQVHTTWGNFKIGNVSNPYDKTVYGIGYIDEGKYKAKEGHISSKRYEIWYSMIKRCYDEENRDKNPTYRDCIVAETWHNFQNFAKWYDENYYEIDREKMHLDKDILIKNNKVYSPQTCIFVPERINSLFTNRKSNKGKYPIGVHHYNYKDSNKYLAKISKNKKREHLGLFETIEGAFNAYKVAKEKYVKEVADEYKDMIPDKLYKALYNYKVEITD